MKPSRYPWALGLGAAAVYLVTRTRDVGGDDTVFAAAAELFLRDRALEWEFFHPHHLAYDPLVAVLTASLRALGVAISTLDAGAVVSAICGGVAVAFAAGAARALGAPVRIAALAAGVLAASGGLWNFATRMEVYALAAAALAAWFAVTSGERSRPVLSGLALAAAILSHAVLGILALPTAWRFRREPKSLAHSLGIGIGIPAAATLAMAILVRGAKTPASWLAVVFPEESRAYVQSAEPLAVLGALRQLVAWGWYREVPVVSAGASRLFDACGIFAAAILLVLLFWALRALGRSRAATLAAVAVASFLPVWVFWQPGNVEHAVAASPVLALLAAAGAMRLPGRWGEGLLAAAFLALLVANGLGCALPQSQPENGRVWTTAAFVEKTTSPSALVLSVGTDERLRLGLPYVSGRHVADLSLAVRAAKLHGRTAADGLAAWLARADGATELWAQDDLFDADSERTIAGLGIDTDQWTGVRARLTPRFSVELPADGAVIRKPFVLRRIR